MRCKLRTLFPKSSKLLEEFIVKECADIYSVSAIVYFLDTHRLFIGITSDSQGEDFICELNSVLLNAKESRQNAEEFCIIEAFYILEEELNKQENG